MLSTVPRYPDKFSRNTSFLTFIHSKLSPWRCAEPLKPKSKSRTKTTSLAGTSDYLRRMRNWTGNTGNSTHQSDHARYVLITREVSERQPQESVREDIRQVSPIDAQNENLTRDSGNGVNSPATPTATLLAHEALTINNSLEMPSKVTRDITGSPRSRQNNDPLADLGKVNEYLIHRKRITIDRLMALLDKWLDINPAFARHAQEGPTSSSRCAASEKGDTCSTGTGPGHSSFRPKRGLPGNGIDGSDPSDDGDGKKERGNKRSRVDSPRAPHFACPFFKNDPSKHKHRQACTGPGWPSISRLKEHIYRCHFQRYKCVRCYEAFRCTEELEEHQRADVPCYKSNAKNNADITEAQNQLLRKKPSSGKASTKQWTEIYQIIFPKAEEIPSPYYEYEEGRSSQEWDATQAYREVLRDEVTQRVRERLEARFDQIEDSLKADFLDIVRNAFRDTLKEHPDPHRSSHRGSAETQEVGPPTSGASQAITVADTGASPSEDMFSYLDLDFQLLPATYIGDASLLPYAEQLPPDCELGPYIFPTDNPVDSGTGLWRAQRGVPGAARSRCRGL